MSAARSESPGPAAVADAIRAEILVGDLVPGQRLVESELSEKYGASRGSVRNALVSLDHAGLVERIANRGARVRQVSVEEAVAITEVRMVVEGLCAAKAAQKVSDPEISELRDIGARMQEAVRSGEPMVYADLNVRLHDRIREIADHPVASEILGSLMARNVRHRFRLALRPGRPNISLPEHLAIIDEVCARSPEGAERAARRHVLSVIATMRETA